MPPCNYGRYLFENSNSGDIRSIRGNEGWCMGAREQQAGAHRRRELLQPRVLEDVQAVRPLSHLVSLDIGN